MADLSLLVHSQVLLLHIAPIEARQEGGLACLASLMKNCEVSFKRELLTLRLLHVSQALPCLGCFDLSFKGSSKLVLAEEVLEMVGFEDIDSRETLYC